MIQNLWICSNLHKRLRCTDGNFLQILINRVGIHLLEVDWQEWVNMNKVSPVKIINIFQFKIQYINERENALTWSQNLGLTIQHYVSKTIRAFSDFAASQKIILFICPPFHVGFSLGSENTLSKTNWKAGVKGNDKISIMGMHFELSILSTQN